MSNLASIQQAIAAASEGNTKTAISILRGLIKENPGNTDAWLALADIVENPNQAKQCWERVLQIEPDNQIAQQKLFGEVPNELDFLFEMDDEPTQEPEEDQQEVSTLDFSDLYTQENQPSQSTFEPSQPYQTEPEQSQSENQDAPSTPTSAPDEKKPAQQPAPLQDPATKKRVQKKKRGLSGIEIGLIVIIVFMCLCLCVIGFASFAKNSVLESLEYSDFLIQEPTDLPDDVTAVIYENIRASNAKDFNRYMATIHAESPGYNTTKETIESAFSDDFTLSYRVSDVYIIEQGRNKAVVHFTLTTKLVSGSISFRDNQVTGEMTLRKEDSGWKIYDQNVDNVEYLD